MIEQLKDFIKRHWPVMRLRTIILGTLLFTAALPGVGALFLRVYENTLIRQTEAELVAQAAALDAAYSVRLPGTPGVPLPTYGRGEDSEYGPSVERSSVDLNDADILPPRPDAVTPKMPPSLADLALGKAFAPVLTHTAEATNAAIQLLDSHGNVLTGLEAGRSQSELPEVQAALAGAPMTVLRRNGDFQPRYSFEWLSRASGIRLHHARPVIVDGKVRAVLLLSRSSRVLFEGLYQDMGKIMIGVLAIFATPLLITAILVRAIVRPVESLSRASRAVAAGHGTVPDSPGLAVVEIRDLFHNFQVMAETITRRAAYLRDFAASVSHEFKTPLTGIRGSIELLEDHGDTMLPDERRRFLTNMSGDADRLSHLVTRLMELAQADMQISDLSARTDLAGSIARIADGLRSAGFAIECTAPASLTANAPATTVEAVTTTLIENSKQAGAHQMQIAVQRSGALAVIDYRDNGPGIAAGDRERIFHPFFTTKRALGGTGLGLAIACSLVEASAGTLELLPSDSGAHFRLSLRT